MNAKVAPNDAIVAKKPIAPPRVHATLFANAKSNNRLIPLTLNPSLMSAILAGDNKQFKTLLHAPQMQPDNPWRPEAIDGNSAALIVTLAAVNSNLPSPAFQPQKLDSVEEEHRKVRIILQQTLGLDPQMIDAIMANPAILALIYSSPTSDRYAARIGIIDQLKTRRPDLFNTMGSDLLELRTNKAMTVEHYNNATNALATLGALADSMAPTP